MKMSATLVRGTQLGMALLLCAGSAGAQMYKWTDAKGVVHYGDQPPPGGARAETRAVDGGPRQVELPYGLAAAVRASPVLLYTTADCKACDDGRALLKQRGIPFSEKTVSSNQDLQQLKEAGGDGELPLLVVGRERRTGFEAGAWHEALSSAAYPQQKMLPRNYRYPAAEAAAPRPLARNDAPAAAPDAPARPKAAPDDAPPGFRF